MEYGVNKLQKYNEKEFMKKIVLRCCEGEHLSIS